MWHPFATFCYVAPDSCSLDSSARQRAFLLSGEGRLPLWWSSLADWASHCSQLLRSNGIDVLCAHRSLSKCQRGCSYLGTAACLKVRVGPESLPILLCLLSGGPAVSVQYRTPTREREITPFVKDLVAAQVLKPFPSITLQPAWPSHPALQLAPRLFLKLNAWPLEAWESLMWRLHFGGGYLAANRDPTGLASQTMVS